MWTDHLAQELKKRNLGMAEFRAVLLRLLDKQVIYRAPLPFQYPQTTSTGEVLGSGRRRAMDWYPGDHHAFHLERARHRAGCRTDGVGSD